MTDPPLRRRQVAVRDMDEVMLLTNASTATAEHSASRGSAGRPQCLDNIDLHGCVLWSQARMDDRGHSGGENAVGADVDRR